MPEVEAAGLVLESDVVGDVGDVGDDGVVGLALAEVDGGGSSGVLGRVVGGSVVGRGLVVV
jgi:hypothetical protein